MKGKSTSVFIFFMLHICMRFCLSGSTKCGYQSCNAVKDGMINVHLVPHTHDDVGWLKTVDQYYYGDKNFIQNAGVQYILDSVVQELLDDPNKRFIYVEIAFFARWWRQLADSRRHIVKGLVNEGRLEFILGGWCMDDEATTHYNAIIDQHALGFEFLRQNFGECGRPRVAWQIDPFGHSREQASLFARMGFDGLFFGRLDYQDKLHRMKTKSMEMMWKGSPINLGSVSDLFTGVLYNGYGPPPGFCWDIGCHDEPIMDDPRMHDFNVDEKIDTFINYTLHQASSYATNHLIMTMGSDFNYQNANTWYKNMDKLIHYVNARQSRGSKINLLYSTPSCYLYNLNKANKTWPTKEDDFFPYAHRPHTFWTGFYTSRPTLKSFVRQSNNFFQVCKQLDALAKLEDTDNSTVHIQVFREALGVAQHHDAVSGTEKQAVAYDYAQRLAKGQFECQKVVNDAIKKLLPKQKSQKAPDQFFCNLFNISFCPVTENLKQFTMTVYNPLGRRVTSWIRLPVVGDSYTVTGPDGKWINSQIIPISTETKRIPERKRSIAVNELIFPVSLPQLGFSTYFIKMSPGSGEMSPDRQKSTILPVQGPGVVTLSNQHLSLTFSGTTGGLLAMKNLNTGISLPLQQQFQYYTSFGGNSSDSQFQASGAYIFRPNVSTADNFQMKILKSSKIVQGKLVQEVHQQFGPWVSQVIRLYDDEKYAEFEWTVGPIPVGDNIGKEIISKFSTGLKNNGIFYTDANGREILKRQRDHRDTWTFNNTEPIAGNYYPINSRIFIRDESRNIQFTILTDRSQGGSTIEDGNLEIMVHRRVLYDDHLGVGEPLNETGADGKGLIARGKHYIFLDNIANSYQLQRDLALRLYMAPSISFSNSVMKQQEWNQKFYTTWTGLRRPLPDNVHMLTLEQWAGPTITPAAIQPYLMRFEHIYEKGEAGDLSKPVKISLQNLFVPFDVDSIEELTLGANLALNQLNRLQWKTEDRQRESKHDDVLRFKSLADNTTITLNPMEIRTFQVKLKQV